MRERSLDSFPASAGRRHVAERGPYEASPAVDWWHAPDWSEACLEREARVQPPTDDDAAFWRRPGKPGQHRSGGA